MYIHVLLNKGGIRIPEVKVYTLLEVFLLLALPHMKLVVQIVATMVQCLSMWTTKQETISVCKVLSMVGQRRKRKTSPSLVCRPFPLPLRIYLLLINHSNTMEKILHVLPGL